MPSHFNCCNCRTIRNRCQIWTCRRWYFRGSEKFEGNYIIVTATKTSRPCRNSFPITLLLVTMNHSNERWKKNNYLISLRRKTRPKSNSRFNQQETEEFFKFNCKYVSIWMCVTLSGAWLFSLSYMLAIVHSEFHELNKDVKKCKYEIEVNANGVYFIQQVYHLNQISSSFSE